MMRHPRLLAPALALLVAVPLALTACASPSGSGASTSPTASGSPSPHGNGGDDADLEAAWLADGGAVGIVTYGSSSCVPMAGEPTFADGTLTVELTDLDGQACTRDYAPRATYVGLPEGVDPTQDLDIVVTGTYAGDVELDGDPSLTAPSGEMLEFPPSAGWFDSDGFLLLTWGSSTCVPVLESATVASATEVAVVFQTPPADQACTADMAPRVTVVGIDDDDLDDDARVSATLSGAEFTGVSVAIAGTP